MTTRRDANLGVLATAAVALAPGQTVPRQQPIILPPPRPGFGVALGEALKLRRSTREFAARALPPQVLSKLLWSAYGVNRPATADRTAPSWRHARETEIFATMADGVWRFDPVAHRLLPHRAARPGFRRRCRASRRRLPRGTAPRRRC